MSKMIIKFTNTTVDPRNEEMTYWFTIKLAGYEYTCIDLGFSKAGELTNASRTFFELDKRTQSEVEVEVKAMLPKVV